MNLQHRQQKIQEKRKKTPWREFVRDICSWSPVMMYKYNSLITVFPDVQRLKISEVKKYTDMRDSLDFVEIGNRGIFENITLLFETVGMPNLLSFFQNENCDYANIVLNAKNVYLSFGSIGCENVLYSYLIKDQSKDVISSVMVRDNCSVVSQSSIVLRSHKVFNSKNIFDSSDIYFSTNIMGCHECIYCDNINNKSYCIENIQYSKEEYMDRKNKLLQHNEQFHESRYVRNLINYGSKNCEGHAILQSEDVQNGFGIYNVKSARNCFLVGSGHGNEDIVDTIFFGSPSGDRAYAVCGGGSGVDKIYCSSHVNGGTNIYYSYFLENSSFCFGCVGLRNKSYCIYNKQYTKEERYEKVDEIFSQMETEGTLGEFFPATMNPFYFNDTAAYLIDPTFTKEEVTALGYLRRDEEIKVDIPEWMETVTISELADYEGRKDETGKITRHSEGNVAKRNEIEESFGYKGDPSTGSGGQGTERGTRRIDPSILKKVIIDEKGNSYRVIKMEYDFLMKYGLPLPRKHWIERMKENFKIQ